MQMLDEECGSFATYKLQRRACIDSRVLSTTVAIPCQTPRASSGRPRANSPAHQLTVSCMRCSPRVCTLVLFICSIFAETPLRFTTGNSKPWLCNLIGQFEPCSLKAHVARMHRSKIMLLLLSYTLCIIL